ncbi:MAG: xanthine phosphoribosyltransferase [Oscillospiraceae bacterium]|nr:xanthine phosphoribosyltransferase [Oscillospiraceae bacterium]
MRMMEEMILREGVVLPGGVLKVGSFLNQLIDPELLRASGEEIARLYDGAGVTKILTVEASGIAIAASAGVAMGVPVLFAKKHRSSNVDGDILSTPVHSFTHGTDYNMVVSRDYLTGGDVCLLVDDFLANGAAMRGMIELVRLAGARLAGAAVAIEKVFQGGGDALRKEGIRVEALGKIESMENGVIRFATAD